ncbi:hypothetical protein HDV57DRAFT_364714 [Trichoderma longibrachiatum]|uniref:Uncharacterized protein n=1 Tax=Trichoderma longibrachiatum ATCC 18648 TaxID=983965 RepID=A0A2T4BX69_TRILO|nr:hypothetical protein M440DRAFT_124613 [Trichoderma longibrachiatum ATCC 18648]
MGRRPPAKQHGNAPQPAPSDLDLLLFALSFGFPSGPGGSLQLFGVSSQPPPLHCVSETRIAKCARRANEAAGSARNRGAPCRIGGSLGSGCVLGQLVCADRG